MNVLLDSCALLALGQGGLPSSSSQTLREAPRAIASCVSPWEIAIKVASGRIGLLGVNSPLVWFEELTSRFDLEVLSIDAAVACSAAALPAIHRDPFDRIIIATALRDNLTILTSDKTIPTYPGVTTLR